MDEITFNEKICIEKNLKTWNNKCCIYFDYNSLPKKYKSLLSLNEKYIVYKILTEENDGMIYIGQTNDFGQRCACHNKNARNHDEQKLYKDMMKHKRAIISIIKICENREEAKKIEKETIMKYREDILFKKYGKIRYLINENEKEMTLFRKIYNIV